MTEQVADVDQVDSGLEQVHRPGPSDDVRGDVHPGGVAGVAAAQGLDVPGEDLGDAPAGQAGVLGPVEQRVCVFADAKVGRTAAEVVVDQLGCGVHQRDPPGLGTFAVQRHRHRAGDADVAGVQVADLLDAGGGVVEHGQQDHVAQTAPGGRVRFGQEGFDLVAGQVAHVSGGGFLLLDSDDLGGLASSPDTWSWQPPAHWRGTGWVLVRPLRQPRTGNTHATPDNPTATVPFLALEHLSSLGDVKLVRPPRYAAAGAPA